MGPEMHVETHGSVWTTPEGSYAATGDVIPAAPFQIAPYQAIDTFITAPFDRLPILDPGQRQAGYGSFCNAGKCASTLVVIGERPARVGDVEAYMGQESQATSWQPTALTQAIEFPPNNSTI